VKIAHAPPVAFLAMPRQSRCTYMRKTITTAAAREWPRPVPSPAALEPPNFQFCRLPGGAGPAAAAPARADALIPCVVVLPTPTTCDPTADETMAPCVHVGHVRGICSALERNCSQTCNTQSSACDRKCSVCLCPPSLSSRGDSEKGLGGPRSAYAVGATPARRGTDRSRYHRTRCLLYHRPLATHERAG